MKTIGIVVVALARGERGVGRDGDQDVGLETDQLDGEIGESLQLAVLVPVFDDDVLALDVAELAQPLLECLQARRIGARRDAGEIADASHLWPAAAARVGSQNAASKAQARIQASLFFTATPAQEYAAGETLVAARRIRG